MIRASSRNAVRISLARTMNFFPSRCASAIQTEKQAPRRHRRIARARPNFFEKLLIGFINLQKHQTAKSFRKRSRTTLAAWLSKKRSPRTSERLNARSGTPLTASVGDTVLRVSREKIAQHRGESPHLRTHYPYRSGNGAIHGRKGRQGNL